MVTGGTGRHNGEVAMITSALEETEQEQPTALIPDQFHEQYFGRPSWLFYSSDDD